MIHEVARAWARVHSLAFEPLECRSEALVAFTALRFAVAWVVAMWRCVIAHAVRCVNAAFNTLPEVILATLELSAHVRARRLQRAHHILAAKASSHEQWRLVERAPELERGTGPSQQRW